MKALVAGTIRSKTPGEPWLEFLPVAVAQRQYGLAARLSSGVEAWTCSKPTPVLSTTRNVRSTLISGSDVGRGGFTGACVRGEYPGCTGKPGATRRRQHATQLALMVICFGLASGRLPTATVKTPFFSSADTASESATSGRVKVLLKDPYERSQAQ